MVQKKVLDTIARQASMMRFCIFYTGMFNLTLRLIKLFIHKLYNHERERERVGERGERGREFCVF